MKNATKQINKLALPRRRADKLSAAALRPTNIGCGDAHARILGLARTVLYRPIVIVGHTVTTIMSLFD